MNAWAFVLALTATFSAGAQGGPAAGTVVDSKSSEPFTLPLPCKQNQALVFGAANNPSCSLGLMECSQYKNEVLQNIEKKVEWKRHFLYENLDVSFSDFEIDKPMPDVSKMKGKHFGDICDLKPAPGVQFTNKCDGAEKAPLYFGCGGSDSEDFERICYKEKQGTFEANAMRGLYVKAIEFQYDQFIKNNSELQGSNPKITIRYPRCAALAREMKDVFEHFGKVAKNVVAQDPSACESTLSNMDFTKPDAKCGTNNDGSTPEMQACYLKGAALYVGGVSGSGMMDLLTCELEEEAKAHYQAATNQGYDFLAQALKIERLSCRNAAENHCSGDADDDEDCARDVLKKCWKGEGGYANYGAKALIKDLYYDQFFNPEHAKQPIVRSVNGIKDTACAGSASCVAGGFFSFASMGLLPSWGGPGGSDYGALNWTAKSDDPFPGSKFPSTSDSIGWQNHGATCRDDWGVWCTGDAANGCCSGTTFVGNSSSCPAGPVEGSLEDLGRQAGGLLAAGELLQRAERLAGSGDVLAADDVELPKNADVSPYAGGQQAGASSNGGTSHSQGNSGGSKNISKNLDNRNPAGNRGGSGGGLGSSGLPGLQAPQMTADGDDDSQSDDETTVVSRGSAYGASGGGAYKNPKGGAPQYGFRGGGDGLSGAGGDVDFGASGKSIDPMASGDPEDYFSYVNVGDDLFKVVERRYRKQSIQWASHRRN